MTSENEYVYEVRLHYGKKLPKMDVLGTIDPYVRICFPGGPAVSRVIIQEPNPQWETDADVLVGVAPASWPICIELWDKDKSSKDDLVCRIAVAVDELPAMRREFRVVRKNAAPDSVLCMTVVRCPAAAALRQLAANRAGDAVTVVDSPAEGYGCHAPLPDAPEFALGVQYDPRQHVRVYLAQTDPASVATMAAYFVHTGEGTVPNRVASHLITSAVAVDASRLDVLRRVGGAKGLRVFGEADLFPAGCLQHFSELGIRVVRRKTLLSCTKASDIAHAHGYPRIVASFADSVRALSNSVVDDTNQLVYFMGDPDVALSLSFSRTAPHVVGYALRPDIFVDIIYTVENERIAELHRTPVAVPHTSIQAYSRVQVAQPPMQCRLEQIYVLKYRFEDVVDIPASSVLPLSY